MRRARHKALFVIDAGPASGMGHVTRASVIAERLAARGYRPAFWVRSGVPPKLESALPSGALVLRNRNALKSWVRDPALAGIVVDTMTLPRLTDVLAGEKKPAVPVIFLGNYLEVPAWADACINAYLKTRLVSRKTRGFFGRRYAVLSAPFERARLTGAPRRIRKNPRTVLLFPGGGDVTRTIAVQALEALQGIPGCRVEMIVGSFFTREKGLGRIFESYRGSLKVFRGLDSAGMLRRMRGADVAVLSFGRSVDEAMSTGLPSVILSHSRLNQLGSLGAIARGGAEYAGPIQKGAAGKIRRAVLRLFDPRRRAKLSREGRRAVDGRGADRVASAIADVFRRHNGRTRKAEAR